MPAGLMRLGMIRVRFELTTHGLEDRCSIQLSYRTVMLRRNILSICELARTVKLFWKFFVKKFKKRTAFGTKGFENDQAKIRILR